MNSIAKPQVPADCGEFQDALNRVYARSRCDHRKPSASESRVAAEMLRQMNLGNIGIDFLDPDTCSAEWSEQAVNSVIGAILREHYSLVVSEWIEEFVSPPYPMSDLIKEHPTYKEKVKAWKSASDEDSDPDPENIQEGGRDVVPYALPRIWP